MGLLDLICLRIVLTLQSSSLAAARIETYSNVIPDSSYVSTTCSSSVSSCRLIIRWVPISRLPEGMRKNTGAIQSARRIWSIFTYLDQTCDPGRLLNREGPSNQVEGWYLHICKGENSRDSNLKLVAKILSQWRKSKEVSAHYLILAARQPAI
jgi:hypothetical protein